VRVVAELSQHTHPKYHAKPGQALDDPRVPMDGESEGELLLEGGDLHVEAAEHGDQGADHLAVGGLELLGRGQLWRRQRVVDGQLQHG
jgi:hypothetical protein